MAALCSLSASNQQRFQNRRWRSRFTVISGGRGASPAPGQQARAKGDSTGMATAEVARL